MSSPSPSNQNTHSATPPASKGKEKKRVGFSQGDGTPMRNEKLHDLAEETDRPSNEGVDHNELTRALSRILQQDPAVAAVASSATNTQLPSTRGTQPQAHQPQHQPQLPQAQVPEPALLPPASPTYLHADRQYQQERSEKAAKERADRLAQSVERDASRQVSRAPSFDGIHPEADDAATAAAISSAIRRRRREKSISHTTGYNPEDPETEEDDHHQLDMPHETALHLVRAHALGSMSAKSSALASSAVRDASFHYDAALAHPTSRSGTNTPTTMYDHDGHEYVPLPNKYHGGVLSSLLRLYNNSNPAPNSSGSAVNSEQSTPIGTPMSSRPPSPGPGDGTETPNKRLSGFFSLKSGKQPPGLAQQKPLHPDSSQLQAPPTSSSHRPWDSKHPHHKYTSSATSLTAGLMGSSSMFVGPASSEVGQAVNERVKAQRPQLKRSKYSGSLFGVSSPKSRKDKDSRRRREEEQIRITVHIAHVLSRHRYLTTLCRALMMYGAPTHRLEDYLKMSARVLEIEAQFLYIPGCMLVSFDDSSTHTAEVKLVRAPQGVDLGKLRDVHGIYKEVVHDLISVDEAAARLDAVMKRNIKFNLWLRVPVYGLASVCVAPFGFQGRFIDLPIAFLLGCIVGTLALVAAPSSAMYSNVFEISAAVITSFLARAFGSISGGNLFCFSALAQSSIALILPGYMVLCASLELQSQNIVAGSVRMVYAMIYTLFLGYGITIGSAVYGAVDDNATSNTTCQNPLSREWYFLFVPLFTICLCIINQAKWKQMPIMVAISVAGFAVNTYASSYFSSNAQIPSTLGAICVGVSANLYARLSRYFERFFSLFWEKSVQPIVSGFNRRRRGRRNWRNLNSASSSRRASPSGMGGAAVTPPSKINEAGEYFDMPPYSSQTQDASSRAEEGKADGGHLDPAEAAAKAAEAERKAPGSAEVIGYGLAAAAMLPAIFVQVPSGLAVNGSLLSGIDAANQLTHNSTTTTTSTSATEGVNSVAFSVLFSVIQVAIGITVGLFLSALLVYPLGKRRSALFSF